MFIILEALLILASKNSSVNVNLFFISINFSKSLLLGYL